MVEEIMKYVSFRDKKRLRLVSPAMYHLITPCDNRFLLWRINLNRNSGVLNTDFASYCLQFKDVAR